MLEKLKEISGGLKTPALVVATVLAIIVALRFLLPVGIVKVLIKYSSWPMLVGICIVMLRDHLSRILAQMPEFINRSYYRMGGEFTPAGDNAKNIGGKDGGCEKGTSAQQDIDPKIAPMAKDGSLSLCEPRWVERLEREYGVQILVNRSIGVSNYYFDAVMEYRGYLYGIDICGDLGHCNLELIFNNVQMAYDGFVPEHKKHFIFMICVTNGSDDECTSLRDIAKRFDFPTVIKY